MKIEKVLDVVSTTSNGAGIWYGISNIKDILGIIVLVVSLISTIATFAIKFIDWYKRSKANDGKIDSDEIKEGIEIVKEGADEIKDKIESKEKEN